MSVTLEELLRARAFNQQFEEYECPNCQTIFTDGCRFGDCEFCGQCCECKEETCICGGPLKDFEYKSPTYGTCGNIKCAQAMDEDDRVDEQY